MNTKEFKLMMQKHLNDMADLVNQFDKEWIDTYSIQTKDIRDYSVKIYNTLFLME